MSINNNFERLGSEYIFAKVSKKLKTVDKNGLIKLGIGDGVLPLPKPLVKSAAIAARDMGKTKTFKGYPPASGYGFLKTAIKDYYRRIGADISEDSIFVNDGAKSGLASILDLFDNITAVINVPSYPAYLSANIIRGNKIHHLYANAQNNYLPTPDGLKLENCLIYICSPDNPTGQVYGRDLLKTWVDFANKTNSIILFDSAYSRYVTTNAPKSIFEIPGAKSCAIEVNSFSKFACFTGLRCGFVIIDEALTFCGKSLNKLFAARQDALFNGVSYITQKCAAAVFTKKGECAAQKTVDYYLDNARQLKAVLKGGGVKVLDTTNSPYIWFECPNGLSGEAFFDYLLDNYKIVGTPGGGFGKDCKNYFRLSGFCTKKDLSLAKTRLQKALKSL